MGETRTKKRTARLFKKKLITLVRSGGKITSFPFIYFGQCLRLVINSFFLHTYIYGKGTQSVKLKLCCLELTAKVPTVKVKTIKKGKKNYVFTSYRWLKRMKHVSNKRAALNKNKMCYRSTVDRKVER